MSLSKEKSFLYVLLEVDEEEILIEKILSNKTKNIPDMFRARKTEGFFFNISIEKHLYRDEWKFSEFFNNVLILIEDDVKLYPCNRVGESITAVEKLAIIIGKHLIF